MMDETSLTTSRQVELVRTIVEQNGSITTAELWLRLFSLSEQKLFPTLDITSLREFLQLHEDVFDFIDDDRVSLKDLITTRTSRAMANLKEKIPRLDNDSVDLVLILKRNIPKIENEIVQILIKMVTEKSKMTLAMLAANMSSLSKVHHDTIGHGQKALVKYLKKYQEIFCIIGDVVSVTSAVKQQLSANFWHSDVTNDGLHQVPCVVSKIGPTFGFLMMDETGENTVYFTSQVFEGGKSQDLTKQLKVGDVVLVDAEKGDPNSSAEWKAIKVMKVKRQAEEPSVKQKRMPSWDRDRDQRSFLSLSECSDLDLRDVSDDISVASSCNTASSELGKRRDEIIKFLRARILSRKGTLSVQNLTGHLSSLPKHMRKCVGSKKDDLQSFLLQNEEHFVLDGENVSLRPKSVEKPVVAKTPAAVEYQSTTPLEDYIGDVATVFSIEANGNGILTLSNGKHAFFESSVVTEKASLKKGTIVNCNATQYSDRLQVNRVWHPSTHTLNDNHIPISAHVSTVVRIFPDFGFIAYGECTEDNIYFGKGVVEGIGESDLTTVLSVGSKVICDATKTNLHRSKYRAIRVIPLIEDDDEVSPSYRAKASSDFVEEIYVSDDEDEKEESADSTLAELYSCTGRVMNVYGTHGFIQRGTAGKDPENVYFNCQAFLTTPRMTIRNLADVVQVGDIVIYDAVLAGEHVSCRWRATAVWKHSKDKSNADLDPIDEILMDQCGTIIKLYPSKGIISIGPHSFHDKVFFTVDNFFLQQRTVSSLLRAVNVGDTVKFDALVDEGEIRMKWKATQVWIGPKPSLCGLYNDNNVSYDYLAQKTTDNKDRASTVRESVNYRDSRDSRDRERESGWRADEFRVTTRKPDIPRFRLRRDGDDRTVSSPQHSLNELEDISLDDVNSLQSGEVHDSTDGLSNNHSTSDSSEFQPDESSSNIKEPATQSGIRNKEKGHGSETSNEGSSVHETPNERATDADKVEQSVDSNRVSEEISKETEPENESSSALPDDVTTANKPTRSSSLSRLNLLDECASGSSSKSLDNLNRPVTIDKKVVSKSQTPKVLVPWDDGTPKEKWIPLVDEPGSERIKKPNVNPSPDAFIGKPPGDLFACKDGPRVLGLLDWQTQKMVELDKVKKDQDSKLPLKSIWDDDDDDRTISSNLNPKPKETKDEMSSMVSPAMINGLPLPIGMPSVWTPNQTAATTSTLSVEFEKAWSVCFQNLRRVCDASKLMLRNAGEGGNVNVDQVCRMLDGIGSFELELANTTAAAAATFSNVDDKSKSVTTIATQTHSTGEILSQHIYSGN